MSKRKHKTPKLRKHRTRPEIRREFEKLLEKQKQDSNARENKLTPKIGLLHWDTLEEVEV